MKKWIGSLAVASVLALCPSAMARVAVGDTEIQYTFQKTGETIPYEVFVPAAFDERKTYPLIVVLHGAGIETKTLLRDSGLDDIAEKLGCVLIAPKGYDKSGGFGAPYPVAGVKDASSTGTATRDPAGSMSRDTPVDAKTRDLSEAETLAAIADVETRVSINKSRVYLMGNSMGAAGAMHLAAKYPTMWAAISVSGGPIAELTYPFATLKDNGIPVLFVHGGDDEESGPTLTRQLADIAKKEGVETEYEEVPRGDNSSAWIRVIPEVFAFFAKHAR